MGFFKRLFSIKSEPSVRINPSFNGVLTYENLLSNEGSIVFILKNDNVSRGGLFWEVSFESYIFTFSINIDRKSLVLERNEALCILPFDGMPMNVDLIVIITWSHNALSIYISTRKGNTPQLKDSNTVKTNSTFIPTEIISWARKKALIPIKIYQSEEILRNTVISCFENIQNKINDSDVSQFWDITYDGNRIQDRKPKKEVHIHPTIKSLLYDQAILLSLQIIPEFKTGVGNLDFLIIGRLKNGNNSRICIEAKNAHSPDLYHGIENQLLDYMTNTNSKYGIYLIYNFEGEWYNNSSYKLKKGTTENPKLAVYLRKSINDNFILSENISLIELRLGKQKSASKH